MAERPKLVLAMGPDILDLVLPAALRTRLDALAAVHPALVTDATTPEATAALADADILLTGWGAPAVDTALLGLAPRLGAVIHAAGTVKGHVRPEVWQRGIAVSSAADANAGPVVDFTMATVVLAARRALGAAVDYTAGRLPAYADRRGADGAVVGVIGASRIGRGVIARLLAAPADYRVLLADPYVSPAEAAALGAESADLDTLCAASDIVTVHAPDLPETHHLLDARRLGLMRNGAAVINTARGRLVDTEALTRECAAGRLDAYLDVTDPEPLPRDHPLHSLRNVLLTPHIAGCQGTEVRRLGAYAVDEVERWTRGEPLLGAVRADDLARIA
ncbi:Phosphoglycerate dehydrogenase [Actinacidiphila alni]|uniref:Phosphoglycerate dehydrogenase n=1 Tax=Actinacidiphila alni TaxID=380248 RepID=A0A1I2MPH2_9ACTN|nr:hydroxyacid dehydrogenase [Actinacidiphila alni]SFF92810.1 Phosphoglycerate dehydrogenase [Actinacidiphila alni]